MSIYSDVHSNASRMISQGLTEGNADKMLSGARLLLQSGNSDSYYLMEPLLNNGSELAGRFLGLISDDYQPVGSDGTVKSDYFTLVMMLEGFARTTPNGLRGKCLEITNAINTDVDAARKRQSEKFSGPRMIDVQKMAMCIHICQTCRPCCPVGRPKGWAPEKRTCKACPSPCGLPGK